MDLEILFDQINLSKYLVKFEAAVCSSISRKFNYILGKQSKLKLLAKTDGDDENYELINFRDLYILCEELIDSIGYVHIKRIIINANQIIKFSKTDNTYNINVNVKEFARMIKRLFYFIIKMNYYIDEYLLNLLSKCISIMVKSINEECVIEWDNTNDYF